MKQYRAFSLAELSIVLAIIAIISGAVMSVASNKTDNYRIKQTKNKLDILEQALAGFVKTNLRLPCPANHTLTPASANYGVEQCSSPPATTTVSNDSLPSIGSTTYSCSSISNNNITGGMIPFKTLNLPREFGIDGWGNKIMYNVTQGFTINTNNIVQYSDVFAYCNMGLITIYGPASSARTLGAVYALISYGPNGYYSYPETSGTTKIASSNIDEKVNGVIASQTYLQAEPNGSFDDIVRYKMRWQIIREAGATVETTACANAKTILETADLLTNNSTFNPYCTAQPNSPDCESAINSTFNPYCTAQPNSPDCESAIYNLSNYLNKNLCLLK